jgi:hypothetical protein
MKKDLESRLRDALRPVAPDEEFTQRLIARVGTRSAARALRPRQLSHPLWWASGIAASLIVGVGVQQHVQAQRELANGLEARRQVLQALAVTSQKLDLAYEAVKSQSSLLIDSEAGA